MRILNHITWKTITELDHSSVLDTKSSNVIIYKEAVKKPVLLQGEKKAPETQLYTSQSKCKEIFLFTSLVKEVMFLVALVCLFVNNIAQKVMNRLL